MDLKNHGRIQPPGSQAERDGRDKLLRRRSAAIVTLVCGMQLH